LPRQQRCAHVLINPANRQTSPERHATVPRFRRVTFASNLTALTHWGPFLLRRRAGPLRPTRKDQSVVVKPDCSATNITRLTPTFFTASNASHGLQKPQRPPTQKPGASSALKPKKAADGSSPYRSFQGRGSRGAARLAGPSGTFAARSLSVRSPSSMLRARGEALIDIARSYALSHSTISRLL
jgi:hypothetical protein